MIKTIFTASSLGEFQMSGYIPCFGVEMVHDNGEPVIVGMKDILASEYTWNKIVQDGLTLYAAVLTTGAGSSSESILMQFMLNENVKIPVVDFGPAIRTSDVELTEAACRRQNVYSLEMFKAIRDTLAGQLIEINRSYLEKTLVVRANITHYVGDRESNLLHLYQQMHFPLTYGDSVMKNPEDELSLKIPHYNSLKRIYARDIAAQERVESLDEDDEEVERPEAARTAAFSSQINLGSEDVSGDGSIQFFDDLKTAINEKQFNVSMGYPYYDSYRYAQCSLTSGIPYTLENIVGYDSNNEADVPYPNERKYFQGLQGLIRYGIQVENDLLTVSEVENAIAEGRHSKIVDKYLQDMARQAFALGRGHTGHVTYSVSIASEEDSSEEDIGLEVRGMYSIELSPDGTKYVRKPMSEDSIAQLQSEYSIFDGFTPIKAYVDNYTWGADSWAKVLIILLRFGTRKPRLMYVPGKNPDKKFYLDLEQSKITERNTNKQTWKLKSFPDGSEYEMYGFIYWRGHPTDMGTFKAQFGVGSWVENMSLPIGVVLARYYEGISDPEFTFVDIFTFIEIVKTKRHKIVGITFDESSETPIKVDSPGEMMDLSVAEMKGYIGRNSDMIIMYINMALKLQYNRLAQAMQGITDKPPEVNIQSYNVFNIVDSLLQANPLNSFLELAQILSSKDEGVISALVKGHNIVGDRAHLPIVNYVAMEKTTMLLDVAAALYEYNPTPAGWAPAKILNTAYSVFYNTGAGRTSRQRQQDALRVEFLKTVKRIGKFSTLMRGDKCVGFVGQVRDSSGRSMLCVWRIGEYDTPKPEQLGSEVPIEVFKAKPYATYLNYKRSGRLGELINRNLFIPTATTMDELAKLAAN